MTEEERMAYFVMVGEATAFLWWEGIGRPDSMMVGVTG
jgi:hypothetical protein